MVKFIAVFLFLVNSLVDDPKKSLFIFIGNECPISQNYSLKLNDLYEEYGNQIEFKGIVSVPGITDKEVETYKKIYSIGFELTADPDLSVANDFNATVTPEVYLVKGDKIFYSGAIDNWYYELGKTRSVVSKNYLEEAIIALLNKEVVEIKRTEPVGCKISKKSYEMDHH